MADNPDGNFLVAAGWCFQHVASVYGHHRHDVANRLSYPSSLDKRLKTGVADAEQTAATISPSFFSVGRFTGLRTGLSGRTW